VRSLRRSFDARWAQAGGAPEGHTGSHALMQRSHTQHTASAYSDTLGAAWPAYMTQEESGPANSDMQLAPNLAHCRTVRSESLNSNAVLLRQGYSGQGAALPV